jgi:hypothetical protein
MADDVTRAAAEAGVAWRDDADIATSAGERAGQGSGDITKPAGLRVWHDFRRCKQYTHDLLPFTLPEPVGPLPMLSSMLSPVGRYYWKLAVREV